MITTEDILSLGWKVGSIQRNGGSISFRLDKSLYTINNHCDNFIYRNNLDPRLHNVSISLYSLENRKFITLWEGVPENIIDFKKILVNTGADLRWIDEIRGEKLNEILKNE